jgi:hypothetical protein
MGGIKGDWLMAGPGTNGFRGPLLGLGRLLKMREQVQNVE